jgi:general L-amino acid transport system permease protein
MQDQFHIFEAFLERHRRGKLRVCSADGGIVRGGLQAVPRGQGEAADAIGLTYWQKNRLIVLPQAIRHVIPPLVNTFIAFFKDTSLVLIIGLFDLLITAKTAIIDPAWSPSASRSISSPR